MSKIEQPSHYQGRGGLNANQVIRAFELNFALGNVVKHRRRPGLGYMMPPQRDPLADAGVVPDLPVEPSAAIGSDPLLETKQNDAAATPNP